MINVIVAVAENGVIGADNSLIWHISEDLQYFKRITTGHPVVMGRKTYESMGRPLPNRTNVYVTRSQREVEGCTVVNSLEQAVGLFAPDEQIFIIGGAQIYAQALPMADRLYITRVHNSYEGDTYFPEWDESEWELVSSVHHECGTMGKGFDHPFTFEEYRRCAVAEQPYYIGQATTADIDLIRKVALVSFEQTYKDIVPVEQNDYMLDMMYSRESLLGQFAEGQRYYLLFVEGEIVGFVSLNQLSDSRIHLEKLYTLHRLHGQGYGRVLMDLAIAESRRILAVPEHRDRPYVLELTVNRNNSRARAFYAKFGFETIESGTYKIEGTQFLRPDDILAIEL